MNGRRIVIEGQSQLRCEAFDVPEELRLGHILVRVHYSLISPGTELSGYTGGQRQFYVGYTAVGEVLRGGEGVAPARIGKMVFLFPEMQDSNHCHATHKVFAPGGLAPELPAGLDPKKACFARMVNIGLTPYCNAASKTMGSVLVIGLGLVGNVIGQVGRIRGLLTIGADTDETRRRRALEAGFDVVIDPAEQDLVKMVRGLTGGRGAELTVNATGVTQLFIPAIQATADGGEISTLGGARQSVTGELRDVFGEVHARHLTLRGGWELQLPMRSAAACPIAAIEVNLANAFRWLASGALRLDPVWTHTIKPDQFKDAYDALARKDPAYLGVVVDWRE